MKSPQQIKIDLAKKRRAKAEQQHSESTKLQTELLDELRSLNESINDQKTIDISELSDQVSKISEAVDIKEQLELLAAKLDFKPQEVDLSGIEMAIKDSKPVINVDLEDMKKAIIEIRERVEANKAPEQGQQPGDYVPYRRVIKVGNVLLFDDNITGSGGARGGGTDTSGLATSSKQDEIINALTPSILLSKIDTTTTAGVTYIGKAAPGSPAASAVWQIKKLDTNTLALDKTWAANGAFTQVWNDRATTVVYS